MTVVNVKSYESCFQGITVNIPCLGPGDFTCHISFKTRETVNKTK
jgi:hypothetical protein